MRKHSYFIGLIALAVSVARIGAADEAEEFRGYADIDDFRMYYEIHGDGDPVLLLHGGTLSGAASWSRVIPALKNDYRLIVPDSRAHGRSTDSERPLSYGLLTDNIVELLDHLEIEAAHVVGWSDGGIIGIDIALRYPQRLKRLVAYGTNFNKDGLPAEAIDWIKELSPETFHPNIADLVYLQIAPDPDQFGTMISKVVDMWLSEPNWTAEDLAKIRKPVLVIEDSLGLAVLPEHTRAMVAAIPDARLELVDDTNHQAPQEKTEEFVALVRGFLGKE